MNTEILNNKSESKKTKLQMSMGQKPFVFYTMVLLKRMVRIKKSSAHIAAEILKSI